MSTANRVGDEGPPCLTPECGRIDLSKWTSPRNKSASGGFEQETQDRDTFRGKPHQCEKCMTLRMCHRIVCFREIHKAEQAFRH